MPRPRMAMPIPRIGRTPRIPMRPRPPAITWRRMARPRGSGRASLRTRRALAATRRAVLSAMRGRSAGGVPRAAAVRRTLRGPVATRGSRAAPGGGPGCAPRAPWCGRRHDGPPVARRRRRGAPAERAATPATTGSAAHCGWQIRPALRAPRPPTRLRPGIGRGVVRAVAVVGCGWGMTAEDGVSWCRDSVDHRRRCVACDPHRAARGTAQGAAGPTETLIGVFGSKRGGQRGFQGPFVFEPSSSYASPSPNSSDSAASSSSASSKPSSSSAASNSSPSSNSSAASSSSASSNSSPSSNSSKSRRTRPRSFGLVVGEISQHIPLGSAMDIPSDQRRERVFENGLVPARADTAALSRRLDPTWIDFESPVTGARNVVAGNTDLTMSRLTGRGSLAASQAQPTGRTAAVSRMRRRMSAERCPRRPGWCSGGTQGVLDAATDLAGSVGITLAARRRYLLPPPAFRAASPSLPRASALSDALTRRAAGKPNT